MRLEDVQLVVFDFDGVMTDNTVLVDEDGRESVVVNRADGLGVSMLRRKGCPMLILSTETNKVVSARAGKLDIPALQGVDDKAAALTEYCRGMGFDINKTMYVGNDVNDLGAMRLVGVRVVPADAHARVREIADIVLDARGGGGVVRELAGMMCGE